MAAGDGAWTRTVNQDSLRLARADLSPHALRSMVRCRQRRNLPKFVWETRVHRAAAAVRPDRGLAAAGGADLGQVML